MTRLGAGCSRVGRDWGSCVVGGHCRFLVVDRLFEGGGELEIVERFLDDDEGLEAVTCFLGGELGPERRVAPLEVQDPDGLGVAEDGRAEAEEGLMEDEGGREELLLEVDLGEGVVEAAEGVAEEGAR